MSNPDVAKNATTPAPKWRPFCQWKNLCIDEFQGDASGLFSSSGYCWLGIEIAREPRTPAVGFIAFNRSVGIWKDPNPDEPIDGFDEFPGIFWVATIFLTWVAVIQLVMFLILMIALFID